MDCSGLIFIIFLLVGVVTIQAVPIDQKQNYPEDISTVIDKISLSNQTEARDLYVIRTIVYEVGILTNVSSDEDNSTESDEEIDFTFYEPHHHNGTHLNLSNIQFPLQTNISEHILTQIAPVNVDNTRDDPNAPESNFIPGSSGPSPVLLPLIPNQLLNFFSNLSTTNATEGQSLLHNLDPLLHLSGNETNYKKFIK